MLGVCCALVPLVYLAVRASQVPLDEFNEAVLRNQLLPWTLNTVVLVTAVAATTLVLGGLIAWLIVCTDLPGRNLWLALSAMPLAMPSYVAAFGWLATFPTLQGFWPSWMVLTAVSVPYVVLPAAAAMLRSDMALVDVARASGRSPHRAWLVGLGPQVAPAAAAGTLLAGLYTLSDFGAVALLRHEVLTFAIHRQYGSFIGRDRAAAFAVILVVGALLLVLLERSLRGNSRRWSVSSGATRSLTRAHLGRARPLAILVVASPILVAVVLPVVALLQRLTLGTRRPLVWSELLTAIWNTTYVALLGGVLALLFAVFVGVLAARYTGRSVRTLEGLAFSSHALPGIVVGLSLVYLSLKVVPALYQTLFVLVFAYAVLFMPKAVGAVRTSVAGVPPVIPQVAASLGRSRLGAASVTGRLAAPGILTGFLLVVVTAMKELPATLMLRPTGLDTLATEVWSRTAATAPGAAAPYALALVLLAGVPAYLLSRQAREEGP